MYKKLTLLILLILLLSACSGAPATPTPTVGVQPEPVEPTEAPTEETSAEPASESTPQQSLPLVESGESYPAPATPVRSTGAGSYPEATETQAVEAEPVENPALCSERFEFSSGYTIAMEDGLQIIGDLYVPDADEPLPGIVMTHMLNSDRTVWGNLPEEVAKACYVVLNIDLRGHGQTGGDADWELAVQDVQQVLQTLSEMEAVNADSLALIGASIGANVALNAAANTPAVQTVILLSPGLDYAGLTTLDAMESYGERPVMIVASDEDQYAADSSRQLDEAALGESQLIMYSGAGHGTAMFSSEPGLQQAILDWLANQLP